jgi:hypothetical protein
LKKFRDCYSAKIKLGKEVGVAITSMSLGQGFIFLRQVFDLLLEESDLSCALQLNGIKLVP